MTARMTARMAARMATMLTPASTAAPATPTSPPTAAAALAALKLIAAVTLVTAAAGLIHAHAARLPRSTDPARRTTPCSTRHAPRAMLREACPVPASSRIKHSASPILTTCNTPTPTQAVARDTPDDARLGEKGHPRSEPGTRLHARHAHASRKDPLSGPARRSNSQAPFGASRTHPRHAVGSLVTRTRRPRRCSTATNPTTG